MTGETPEPSLPRSGEKIGGKYLVEHVLGAGAMGVVVAARHEILERRVAIKILKPEVSKRAVSVERFLREARAASSIQSKHVARVMDVGTMDNGLPFLVMEYLEGRDLSEVVEQDGPLSVDKGVEYLLQACDALAEAHTRGIVHRDLKPANLFLSSGADGADLVKIVDFGVAKARPEEGVAVDLSLTETAMMLGSPAYMAPEQVRSAKTVDHRADIWALGIIFYRIVAAQAPFEGETFSSLCAAIVADEPKPLRGFLPDLPAAIEKVVMRCLEKNPEARYANVEAFANALAAARHAERGQVAEPALDAKAAELVQPRSTPKLSPKISVDETQDEVSGPDGGSEQPSTDTPGNDLRDSTLRATSLTARNTALALALCALVALFAWSLRAKTPLPAVALLTPSSTNATTSGLAPSSPKPSVSPAAVASASGPTVLVASGSSAASPRGTSTGALIPSRLREPPVSSTSTYLPATAITPPTPAPTKSGTSAIDDPT